MTLTVVGAKGYASIDVDDVDVIVGLSDGRDAWIVDDEDLEPGIAAAVSFLSHGR